MIPTMIPTLVRNADRCIDVYAVAVAVVTEILAEVRVRLAWQPLNSSENARQLSQAGMRRRGVTLIEAHIESGRMREQFETALKHEEEHLQNVRDWVSDCGIDKAQG